MKFIFHVTVNILVVWNFNSSGLNAQICPTVSAGQNVVICQGQSTTLNGSANIDLTINEAFNAGIPYADGWDTINRSQPNPLFTWFRPTNQISFNAYNGSPNSFAVAMFRSIGSGCGTISNWLFTPEINISNGDKFSFFTRTVDTTSYADRLQVRLSTNGVSKFVGNSATSIGDFTTLLFDINPTYTETGYPNAWQMYEVVISNLSAPISGRIAFRYFLEDTAGAGSSSVVCPRSDYIGIDAITFDPNLTYSWFPISGLSNPNILNPIATPDITTTYTLSVTGNGCTTTSQITVTVTPLPTSGTLNGNQTICVGGTTQFSSNVSGGTWTSDNTSIAKVNTMGVVTGEAAGMTTIVYTVAGTGGCQSSSSSRSVTVTPQPSAGILSGNQNICIGGMTAFSSSVSGGNWSSSNPGVATVNSTGIVSGVSIGTATITYTVLGSGGCQNASALRIVTVSAQASAGSLSGTQSICVGGITPFSSSVSGGNWSSSNPGVATVNSSGIVSGVSVGTATITYTVLGSGGCQSATTQRTVTVSAQVSAGSLSGAQSICVGGMTPFSSSVSGGNWSSSNPGVATVNSSGIVSGVSVGTATITYTVLGSGGCQNASALRIITVSAQASAGSLSGAQSICVGGMTPFSSSVSGGNWSSSNPGVATVNSSGIVSGVSLGTAIITYTVLGSGGCQSATAQRTVTVSAQVSAGSLSGAQSICVGGMTQLSSSVSGGNWSSSNPGVATINSIGIVSGVSTGTTIITYLVSSGPNCMASTSIGVIVHPLPFVRILTPENSTNFCIQDEVTLQLNDDFVSYLWSNAAITESIIVNQSGIYSVTVNDENGCSSSESLSLTFHGVGQNANLSDTVCLNHLNSFSDLWVIDALDTSMAENIVFSESGFILTSINGGSIPFQITEIVEIPLEDTLICNFSTNALIVAEPTAVNNNYAFKMITTEFNENGNITTLHEVVGGASNTTYSWGRLFFDKNLNEFITEDLSVNSPYFIERTQAKEFLIYCDISENEANDCPLRLFVSPLSSAVLDSLKSRNIYALSGEQTNKITVFPNPGNDWINILLRHGLDIKRIEFKTTHISGQLIESSILSDSENFPDGVNFSIDVSSWPSGLHFIEVENLETKEFIGIVKFIKQ